MIFTLKTSKQKTITWDSLSREAATQDIINWCEEGELYINCCENEEVRFDQELVTSVRKNNGSYGVGISPEEAAIAADYANRTKQTIAYFENIISCLEQMIP